MGERAEKPKCSSQEKVRHDCGQNEEEANQSMFDFLGEGKLNRDSAEKYSIKCLWTDNEIRRQCSYEGDGALESSEGGTLPLPRTCANTRTPLEENLDLTSCLLQATRMGG